MLSKTTGLGALAIASLLALGSAGVAADLPSRREPLAPLAFKAPADGRSVFLPSWTGFYGGLTLGYDFWRKASPKPNGVEAGVRAGYDYQLSNHVVFGALVEGDLNLGSKTVTGPAATIKTKQTYTLSADVRLGYAINNANLVYVLGGFTRVELEKKLLAGAATGLGAAGRNGWNAGASYEYRITDYLSAFGEARYNRIAVSGARPSFIELKLGMNYRL